VGSRSLTRANPHSYSFLANNTIVSYTERGGIVAFKVDLLFEIEVPRPWGEGKERDRFHEALEQAVFADEMGFDTLWFVEHHFLEEAAHSSAPDALLGALTQRTSRIRLGFGVSLMPGRVNHPIRVAERAAVMDILSDGRLEMGTGRSSSPYQLRAFGVDVANTREEWEEATRLLPQLWTKEKFAYKGRFFSWDDRITVVPRPVQKPHPPLWVASTQPDTCTLAGQKGLGLLMPQLGGPDGAKDSIAAYKAAVANPVDPLGMFTNDQCALFTCGFTNDDDDKARLLGGQAAMWYLQCLSAIYRDDWAGQALEAVPDSYRYHAEVRRKGLVSGGTLQTGMKRGDLQDEKAYERMIDSGAFCIGDPRHVVENVERYRAVGADRLVVVMQLADLRHDDLMRSIELFGKEIIPAIRANEAREADEVLAGAAIEPGR
jgi:alkanesulfonate monooxygenase SsuD/methylene tetrahydromethanopterin reductase-like flavin-dependent oxidoreductase (luciferase family)